MTAPTTPAACRVAQGFVRHPPRCGNCSQYDPPIAPTHPGGPFKAPGCKTGGFAVAPGSVCNLWSGMPKS